MDRVSILDKASQARSGLITLAGGAGLTSLGMGLIIPVLPLYARSMGASATLVGLLLASFGLTRLLVNLPATWLARRVGYRRLLIYSPAIAAPLAVVCALTGGFWVLALFCIMEGTLSGIYTITGTAAVVTETGAEKRGRSLASYQAAGLLGTTLGPALGGLAAQQFGPQAPFLAYAALSSLAAVWFSRRLRQQALHQPADIREDRLTIRTSYKSILIAPGLFTLWLVVFILVFTRVGAQQITLPLLGAWKLGLDPQQIGLALSFSGLASLLLFYPAGWLADRYGRKLLIILGGLGMAGALLVFSISASYLTFVTAALLLGVGSGLAGPAPGAYLADILSSNDLTNGVGVYRLVGDAGATIAPLFFGWITDRGGVGSNLWVSVLALLFAIALFVGFVPVKRS